MSGNVHIWSMISLPPALRTKVSCDHKAGTMASSAPASMKVAPESGFEGTKIGSLLADHETGSTQHRHMNLLKLTDMKKGARGALGVTAAGLGYKPAMDVTNHGAMMCGRGGG